MRRYLFTALLIMTSVSAQGIKKGKSVHSVGRLTEIVTSTKLSRISECVLGWRGKRIAFREETMFMPTECKQTNFYKASYRDNFIWYFGEDGGESFFEASYFATQTSFIVEATAKEVPALIELAETIQPQWRKPLKNDKELLERIRKKCFGYALDQQPNVTPKIFSLIAAEQWAFVDSLILDGWRQSLDGLRLLSKTNINSLSISRVCLSKTDMHRLSLLNPEQLVLKRNLLTTRELKRLKWQNRLKSLDLSFNLIESYDIMLPLLMTLRISGNPLKRLTIPDRNDLVELTADHCDLGPESFSGAFDRVVILNVADNNLGARLEKGWSGFHKTFASVEILDVEGNGLDNATVSFVGQCKKVVVLRLDRNPNITDLSFLKGLSKLEQLTLHINAFRNPREAQRILSSLPKLETIVMSGDVEDMREILPKIKGVKYLFGD